MNGYDNPFIAIQYHLYEHPLYTFCSHAEQNLNVLINIWKSVKPMCGAQIEFHRLRRQKVFNSQWNDRSIT